MEENRCQSAHHIRSLDRLSRMGGIIPGSPEHIYGALNMRLHGGKAKVCGQYRSEYTDRGSLLQPLGKMECLSAFDRLGYISGDRVLHRQFNRAVCHNGNQPVVLVSQKKVAGKKKLPGGARQSGFINECDDRHHVRRQGRHLRIWIRDQTVLRGKYRSSWPNSYCLDDSESVSLGVLPTHNLDVLGKAESVEVDPIPLIGLKHEAKAHRPRPSKPVHQRSRSPCSDGVSDRLPKGELSRCRPGNARFYLAGRNRRARSERGTIGDSPRASSRQGRRGAHVDSAAGLGPRLTHRGISRRRDPRMISGNLGAPGENEAAHLGRSCIEEGTVVRLSNMERFSIAVAATWRSFYCPHAVDQALVVPAFFTDEISPTQNARCLADFWDAAGKKPRTDLLISGRSWDGHILLGASQTGLAYPSRVASLRLVD